MEVGTQRPFQDIEEEKEEMGELNADLPRPLSARFEGYTAQLITLLLLLVTLVLNGLTFA